MSYVLLPVKIFRLKRDTVRSRETLLEIVKEEMGFLLEILVWILKRPTPNNKAEASVKG